MFKNIIDVWQGKAFISKIHEDFANMLDLSEKMFREAQWYIFVDETKEDIHDGIYLMDKEINKLEKNIRTKILEHISLRLVTDIPASLVVMSVVKDAERLGDYIKNVSEARTILKGPVDQDIYKELLGEVEEKIFEMFSSTKKAFINSDKSLAEQVGNNKKILADQCEQIIQKIASSNMKVREAVAYALITRYYKRIISHLGNIATTVILPFSEIGHYKYKGSLPKTNIILGLCTANRCRSQLFEAIFQHLAGDKFKVISAGTNITSVHPLVSKVLAEINIEVERQLSKKIATMNPEIDALVLLDEHGKKSEYHLSEIHSVITLCGGASEVCPMFPGKIRREHWPIDDPDKQGTESEIMPYFRIARDDIYARVKEYLARA